MELTNERTWNERKLFKENVKIRNAFLSSGTRSKSHFKSGTWKGVRGARRGGGLIYYYIWRFVEKNLGFLILEAVLLKLYIIFIFKSFRKFLFFISSKLTNLQSSLINKADRKKQLRCQHLLSLRIYYKITELQNIYLGLGPQPLYNLYTVNENGFTPYAHGRC